MKHLTDDERKRLAGQLLINALHDHTLINAARVRAGLCEMDPGLPADLVDGVVNYIDALDLRLRRT